MILKVPGRLTLLRNADLPTIAEQRCRRFKTGDRCLKARDIVVGAVQKALLAIGRLPVANDPVDAVPVGPVPVKTELIIGDHVKDYATANAQRQTKDIDSGVDLVAGDGAPGDQPVVFQHVGYFEELPLI